jgi:NAD(P)-dependent dehydrogenase (short-subunit alcohol dehydrogenase family)
MANIVLTGGYSGLGKAMWHVLAAAGHVVHVMDLKDGWDVGNFRQCQMSARQVQGCDILINNAGVNLIDYLELFTEEAWDQVMDTNAKGIFNMSRAFIDHLARSKGTILNIISNAAHMPMTASLAYNASKGAAHIMTLQLARELYPRHGITVFGIAPNKLKGTGMSDDIDQQCCKVRGWTLEYAQEYQKKSLPIGEETDPAAVAEFVAFLLQDKAHHKYLHGCVLPYGA